MDMVYLRVLKDEIIFYAREYVRDGQVADDYKLEDSYTALESAIKRYEDYINGYGKVSGRTGILTTYTGQESTTGDEGR